MAAVRPVLAFVFIGFIAGEVRGAQYFGKLIGKLSELHHGVSGEVYAVDSRTLYIKDFTYDGQGPAAYFYAGNSRTPGSSGFRLRDEKGNGEVIRRYRKEGLTLSLPEGKTLNNIKIFYVWCEEFAVNFGDVKIPRNFDYPRPVKIDPLQGVHAVSSDNVVVVDAQTLLIPNFSYDGEAPDAKFWVGRGSKPSPQGIRVPDENGKEIPLRRYDRKTIVLNLPGDLTVFEIGHFGVWCEAFTVDFGHILIPQNINVPPSLKMLGISPQSKLNCEVLQDSTAFEVRWAMAGESVIIQLVAKIDGGEYMSFGVSGEEGGSVMIKGDVAVAYIEKDTLKGKADDYYLRDKSQCSGRTGSCPDRIFRENSDSVKMLNAAQVNGYSIVTYQRPLRAEDEFDQPIYANQSTPIIWAIGPLNQRNEVSFHSEYLKKDMFIHFGRTPKWNCPAPEVEQPMKITPKTTIDEDEEEAVTTPSRSRNNERRRGSNRNRGNSVQESEVSESERVASRLEHTGKRGSNKISEDNSRRNIPTPAPASKKNPWIIPAIQCHEPEDGVFYAQMGPTGGKRGYPAITGHVGWGISWYINGLLIPEINVVRGKTYTFVIEGGLDPNVPAKYHPFYITDDPVGGYEHQSAEDKKNIRIFAGAQQDKDGNVHPTGTGRLCHWTQKGDLEADDFASFGAYQRTLELKCDQGEPGVIQWTPDDNTPDTVYYQCFTHRYLGWKINVLDACDEQTAASETKIISVPIYEDIAEEYFDKKAETMVTPNSFSSEDIEDKVAYKISAVGDDIVAFPDKQSKMIRNELPYPNPQSFYFNRNMYQPNNYPNHLNYYSQNPHQNPYMVQYNPYQSQSQTFRPSPMIYTGLEELPRDEFHSSIIPPTVISQISSTTSTTSTTTSTTTPPPTTSTTSTTTAHLLETSSNNIPNKTIVISFAKNPQRQPVRSYIKVPLTTSSKKKPVRHLAALVRPSYHHISMNHQKQIIHPASLYHHASNINPSNKASFRLKNHVRPNINSPFMMHQKQRSNAQLTKQSSSVIILTPQVKLVTKSPHSLPSSATVVKDHNSLNNIISLKKTDTDKLVSRIGPTSKEINALEVIYPTKDTIQNPTKNSGFQPENIQIENGFIPIRDRSDSIIQNELDTEEGTKNSLNLNSIPLQHFPKIKRTTKRSEPSYFRMRIKFARDLKEVSEKPEIDDTLAEPSNRQIYYLPPDNQKHPPQASISQPSNIDIVPEESDIDLETAPDVVVTYDGKRVSGASLTAKLADSMRTLNTKSLRTSEFIRTRPQSVPFKGELPPLDDIKPPELNQRATLNRNLDVPFLTDSGSSSHNNPTSTKLTLVKSSSLRRTSREVRKKRNPHHTAEHTRQQNEERLNNSCFTLVPSSILVVVLVQTLLFI